MTHCRKGRFIKDHPGKKRGTCASRAGLSDEKVCIITAVQRLGKCIARSLNVSKPSIKKFSFFQVIFVLPYEPQASLRVGGDMNMLVIVFLLVLIALYYRYRKWVMKHDGKFGNRRCN